MLLYKEPKVQEDITLLQQNTKTTLCLQEAEKHLDAVRAYLKAFGHVPDVSRFAPDDIRLHVDDRFVEGLMSFARRRGILFSMEPKAFTASASFAIS